MHYAYDGFWFWKGNKKILYGCLQYLFIAFYGMLNLSPWTLRYVSSLKPEPSHPFSSEIIVTGFDRKGSSFPPKHREFLFFEEHYREDLWGMVMMTQAWFALSEALSACEVVRRGLLPVNRAWHGTTLPDD